jgi:outer membrane protein TolC
MKKTFLLTALFFVNSASALTLTEYLAQVEQKNKSFQALNIYEQSIQLDFLAFDKDLIPTFTMKGSYLSDKSPANQFILMGASEVKVTEYSAALAKRFTSGTSVEVSANVTETDAPGVVFPNVTMPITTGSLGISFAQSMWRDFFGASTRMRYERQEHQGQIRRNEYDLKRKLALNQAEAAFWEYLYAQENVKISRNSLERGKRIENWTRRRVSDGISDRADLYQAQALVAARQMMLVTAEDEFETAKRQIRDSLELAESEPLPALVGDIAKARPLTMDISGKKGKIVQIEAYMASLNAKALAVQARETEDSYRPDLVLSGAYNTNSKEDSIPKAAQKWGETSKPTARVGLTFTYLFDTDVKRGAQDAARSTALAAKLESERKMLESDSAWIELNRRYIEMGKRVEAANQLSQLQNQYARAQSDLFNKGRSITNTVVQAEEDAATAERDLMRLRAEQRKMETQGRLFVVIEE